MDTLEQLDRLVELQRRREQLAKAVPPDIKTEKIELPDGTVLFRFIHDLGALGQLRITPVLSSMVPADQCVINVEIFPDHPDEDEHWDEKYHLLETMVTLCVSALPGEQAGSPLPSLPVAKEQRRLYLRFTACRHSDELHAFAASLTQGQYQALLAGVQQARVTASTSDQAGLLQRLDELHRLWGELHPDVLL
jgi:hypothetical protein